MNGRQIQEIVHREIGDAWDTSNLHGVNLREALVFPEPITVIERSVQAGNLVDRLVDAWIVLVEEAGTESGYRIVAARDGSVFGLANEGFPTDKHLVLVGWYGDFLTTFRAM
jgi:hypothetical protein